MSLVKASRIVCALAATVVLATAASADISSTVFQIVACNTAGQCIGGLPIDIGAGTLNADGSYYWQLGADTNLLNMSGIPDEDIGILSTEQGGTSITIIPPGQGRSDPQVIVNFSVIGGSTAGVFTITSALVSFPTISSATGKVDVGINLTDRPGSTTGASLDSVAPHIGKSFSWVNGLPGDGGATMFRELFASNMYTTGSISQSDATAGFEAIGTSVSSMSGQIEFALSARDLASGSSTFLVTPEPASLLMLLGLALLRRR